MEKLLIGRSGALLQKQVLENFDRSTLSSIDQLRKKFLSIDFSGSPNFQAFPHRFCHSSLIDLQNIKTQKLTKASLNNNAKCLTSANQWVQIHNIWHSSVTCLLVMGFLYWAKPFFIGQSGCFLG
jgi:hypothetical protein